MIGIKKPLKSTIYNMLILMAFLYAIDFIDFLQQ